MSTQETIGRFDDNQPHSQEQAIVENALVASVHAQLDKSLCASWQAKEERRFGGRHLIRIGQATRAAGDFVR